MSELITGIMPVTPTPFHDDESLDVDGVRRVVDFVIDCEVDALCILANYSEQFTLTDAERETVARTTLEHVAGRVPVCVTTSHLSTRITVERSRQAEQLGAKMIMAMPPFYGATLKIDEAGVYDFFAQLCTAVSIDVMIQDAPMSTTALSVGLLARLAHDFDNLRYVKVEVPRAADKLRALAAAAGDDLPGLFDGEEAVTLLPDLIAGSVGTMSSALVPDRLGIAVRAYLAGDRAAAQAEYEDLLPLIHFENRQCGLVATKVAMAEGGIIGSSRTRAPIAGLPTETVTELLDLARRKHAKVLTWGGTPPR